MANKSKCYLYTRVSTEMQVDGFSLEAQKERLKSEAAHRNMKVVGEYSDEGKSGKNIKGRPAFQKMLEDIKSKKDSVDYVLVFKLSRFGRNTADILNSLQYMEDYGVHLLCVEDGIDSAGAAGKLMISVLAAVAEIERENIKEQTMAGRRQKARDGQWNGGFAPYGYKLVHKEGERGGTLEIEEKEAELVRLIYDKYYKDDLGLSGVAKWLNDNHYTKSIRQNGTIEKISASFVKGILDNPVYMGKIAYGRRKTEKIDGSRNEFHVVRQADEAIEIYDGLHEAIIPEDLWYKVHARRKLTGVKYEKKHSLDHVHILSGLVHCPVCGSQMYGVVNRKKKKGSKDFYEDIWYYRCKNHTKATGHDCSYKKYIRQDRLNAEVIELVKWVMSHEEYKKMIAQKSGDSESTTLDEVLKEGGRLQKEKTKIENKKKKLLSKISAMDADDENYDTMYDEIMEIIKNFTKEIAEIDADIMRNKVAEENVREETFSTKQYLAIMDMIVNNLEEIPDAQLKRLMQLMIDRVDVFPDDSHGCILKAVRFKIPLRDMDTGKPFDTFEITGVTDENGRQVFLPIEEQDETCVLLSRREVDLY